jgi:hypothetical protein
MSCLVASRGDCGFRGVTVTKSKGVHTLLIAVVALVMNYPQRLLACSGGAHRRPVAPLVELIRDGRRRGTEGPTSSKLGPTGAVR